MCPSNPPSSHGQVFVIAAPSGAGKTSLVRALVKTNSDIAVAVSHTTRPKRPHEVDGVDYHFVSPADFQALEAANGFVESAQVFGNFYGTSRAAMEAITKQGLHLVLEIDWQGAIQIRQAVPHARTIFILPPSLQALKERLHNRNQDDDHTIAQRMAEAISELSHYHEFDYLVVNDDFDTALEQLKQIFRNEAPELAISEQSVALADLIEDLLPSRQQKHR